MEVSESSTPSSQKKNKGELIFTSFTTLSSWFFITVFLVSPILFVLGYTLIVDQQVNYEVQLENSAKEGYYDASLYDFQEGLPLALDGTWSMLPDLFIDSPTLPNLEEYSLTAREYTTLPITDFSKSQGAVTYRANVNFPSSQNPQDPMVLGIDFLKNDVSIYLNRVKLDPYTPWGNLWNSLSSTTYFDLTEQYDPQLEFQEITISVNSHPDDTDLYSRSIRLSTYANGLYQEKTQQLLELLFGGIAYCLMMIGFIYMIIRPNRSVLTLINLFDIVLIVFVIYAHTNISPFLGMFIPSLNLGDTVIQGMALFFLCMSVPLGNDLTDSLFLCEKKIHPIFSHPLNFCFITLAVIFACNPFWSAGILYYVLLFLGVVFASCVGWRIWALASLRPLSKYELFQAVKTLYIALILFGDILTMNSTIHTNHFLLANYCIFFIVHLFVRAYEYALPEKKIAEINRNLEATVAERTEKLTTANQILKEVSVRDALTKAHNRMFFEEELNKALSEFHHHQAEEPLRIHLCIFDLDNFKQINDQFGHNTGDEQLIETIEMAQSIMPADVLISRIGGEEFTFLFREREEQEILELLEQMRCALEYRAQETEGRTTGSFGLTRATVFCDRKTFFIQADQCLYYSKQHGKNCITHDFSGELSIADKTT